MNKHALITALLALIHGAAGLTILIVSSWFIAISAIAPVGFNYVIPAVVIRGLALLRIASGYAYMWLGHSDLLRRVAEQRMSVFATLKQQKLNNKAWTIEALANHTERLASAWIAWVSPLGSVSLIMLGLVTTATLFALPGVAFLWTLLFAWTVCLCRMGIFAIGKVSNLSHDETEFRQQSEDFFSNSALWHLVCQQHEDYEDFIPQTPSAEKVWINSSHQIAGLLITTWVFQGMTLALAVGAVVVGNRYGVYTPIMLVVPMVLLAAPDWIGSSFGALLKWTEWVQSKKELQSIDAVPLLTLCPIPPKNDLEIKEFSIHGRNRLPINTKFPAKGCVVLTGESGCGKSSVLQGIAGMLPYSGTRAVDGRSLSTGMVSGWLYVEQQPIVLSGSIKLNLDPSGSGITESAMGNVLAALSLNTLSDLSEWVGNEARLLSGGESKRLTLARALLAKPDVLLVDEPFEGLDEATQNVVAHALNRFAGEKLVVVASHVIPDSLDSGKTIDLSEPMTASASSIGST
ncbi:ATP-binding cassette domain-containing protein [Alteromonas sp. KUL49]|uniref:ATP-binding cassette domain-containing protein n=1 Tax=Alteromonas sp. KUL49 TaxID=2480798 RepID=UPI00102EE46C|nr:ATP-binding cassette domain-containing protein [Alteromonas sp. KUL49]TAP42386.1 ATP-binding cassette domain-containing protein [Alteromonas sp. KUL49]GEA10004.1 cysteine/glutathione ABC transporter ATP-binding protein/permease CydC [Alteromonas sp. KUL49]